MSLEFWGKIKVPSKIKPILRKDRITPELKENNRYYICFGNNNVYPCRLLAVVNKFDQTEVKVQFRVKPRFAKFRKNGITTYEPYVEHLVYANEIGETPEEAVRNMV